MPTIIKLTRDTGAEVIVVGKRSAGRVSGLRLGSPLQKLVSFAPMVVTVVP